TRQNVQLLGRVPLTLMRARILLKPRRHDRSPGSPLWCLAGPSPAHVLCSSIFRTRGRGAPVRAVAPFVAARGASGVLFYRTFATTGVARAQHFPFRAGAVSSAHSISRVAYG